MFVNFSMIRLTPDYIIKPFDCGDSDINEFFFYILIFFCKELFTVTYVV